MLISRINKMVDIIDYLELYINKKTKWRYAL